MSQNEITRVPEQTLVPTKPLGEKNECELHPGVWRKSGARPV